MRTSFFDIRELVYPEIFKERGEKCWELLDRRLLESLQSLRSKFGIITVNNWHIGGDFDERGLRSFFTATGAKFSQHRFGRAADCSFKYHTAEEVRQYVLAHPQEFPFITCVERDVSWFHFDVRNHNGVGQIMVVSP